MKYLVIGGAGVFALHFINRILKEKSTTRVLSVGRNKERSDAFTLGVGNGDKRYSYKQIHMTFESDFLIEAVEHLKPNYIKTLLRLLMLILGQSLQDIMIQISLH